MAEQPRALKECAREIFAATLAQLDLGCAFQRKITRHGTRLALGNDTLELGGYRDILTISFGKAAWAMAVSLVETLAPDFSPHGIAVSNTLPPENLPGFRTFVAGHPYPNGESLAAAEAILAALAKTDEKTLVFFLISGGGSALVEKPLPGLTLDDLCGVHQVLVNCGARIAEVNAIRKHLSAVKGGRLAEAAPQAERVTILVSDVPEGELDTIASGPTLPDASSVEDCYQVAARYHLRPDFPLSIRRLFEQRTLAETPKGDRPVFARGRVFVLLSSRDVLHAAHRAAGALGFLPECDMCCDEWEVERAADFLLDRVRALRREAPGQPVCLISGGELSSPVTGAGQGGRNQAFVLYAVLKIAGESLAVLSAGTDGIDGNSPAAGAVADGETLVRARANGMDVEDYFQRSDSYHFFRALGDAILIGPQPLNLRDLRLLLAPP
ncbi:MAG: glycerate kinase [Terriglobia bacterium]